MPYKLQQRGNKTCVVNKETGQTKGCSDSKSKAMGMMRLLYGVEHGLKPTGEKGEPMKK